MSKDDTLSEPSCYCRLHCGMKIILFAALQRIIKMKIDMRDTGLLFPENDFSTLRLNNRTEHT
jgi:hypothetical protein